MNKSNPEENKHISVDERPKLFGKNPNKEKSEKNEVEDEDEYEKEESFQKDYMGNENYNYNENESDDEDLNKDDSNINRSSDKPGELKNEKYENEIY
jgi:hypothetical protein